MTLNIQENILLIDDSRDERGMMAQALTAAGFTPIEAADGEQGLALARKNAPDLIVLDAMMPGMDGFETCRRLKSDALCGDIPVIFMTGLTETRHVVSALQAGGVDYVTKPIIIAELLARIRVHIDNARPARGARIGLDASGRHLLAIDGAGHILWRTPQAGVALAEVFGDPTGAEIETGLAELVAGGLPRSGRIDHNGAALRFEFLCPSQPGEFLFRLTRDDGPDEAAILRRRFGLTDREAEVLLWLARGKSNAEIGAVLLISPRTVNKHLEHVFTKLGVENRSSATGLTLQALGARD